MYRSIVSIRSTTTNLQVPIPIVAVVILPVCKPPIPIVAFVVVAVGVVVGVVVEC